MVAVLGGDDFRGHAGVVAVALDEALRPRWFFHAAGRLVFAGVLGDPRHADLELGPLEFQRLLGVVADQLPLAVRGAVGHFPGASQRDFVAGQMGGERLVAGLPRLAAATLVLARPGSFRLFHGGGQAVGRVGGLRRVAEVQPHLVRVFAVPLAAVVEQYVV